LWENAGTPDAQTLQSELAELRRAVTAHPLIAAVRYLTGRHRNDPSWERPMPPLEPLAMEARKRLQALVSVSP